ncbi:TPA: site-specific DNA-methyltransferase [Candidatus Woesearchaeota archaeon]|nr:site-specific DNA-methyltransferase [Candidatus Woesearchaeota archaeon]HIH31300.1 site-specific DNA-methyltransferase [Candidatus Woesearchaeota archaeon]HIH55409.1 site-specific DNA-methyltransferase [Candidatus Woesearchaeota archaeon]HIJ01601.1 site-specific DNA-methyltransferase [Candidatus Woesearchaeota archaeon]HIJ14600.1 site-specific DNA-methyltransferase [Candidatus Woesearchaeota archaeon]
MELNKIACMDCLEYLGQIPDNFVDLVVTDPPYNVSQKNNLKFGGRVIIKNFGDWDFGFDPVPVLAELRRILKPNGQIYVFCGTEQIPIYIREFIENWFFRNLLVWYKTNPPPRMSKTNYLFANEYIIYAIKEKGKPSLSTFNFSSQSTMHNTFISGALQGKERLKGKNGMAIHPTQKPLAILKKLIEVSSNPGDIILDPFMGIGSTAVACKELKRKFIGCELNPKYVAWANSRLNTRNN